MGPTGRGPSSGIGSPVTLEFARLDGAIVTNPASAPENARVQKPEPEDFVPGASAVPGPIVMTEPTPPKCSKGKRRGK